MQLYITAVSEELSEELLYKGEKQRLSFYDGEWQHDVKCGEGTQVYPSGNKYSGGWRNNVKHGRGISRRSGSSRTRLYRVAE